MRVAWLFVFLACLTAMVAIRAGTAIAADAKSVYPTKPVRVIVPFPAGGGTDFMARVIGEKLSESLGQSFVMDNRPGAGSTLGSAIAAGATPDGYTLLLASNGITVSAELYKNLSYSATKDFMPISLAGTSPNVLVVNASVPASTVTELIELAKSQPGKINYASGGIGGSAHLCAAYFLGRTEIKVTHVAYKGTPPALTDVIAGNVEFMMAPIAPAIPQVSAGRIRALGVTSAKRTSLLPEVPSISEAGVPKFEYESWYGLLAPAGTPGRIVGLLNNEMKKALDSPDVRARMGRQGVEPAWTTVAEFRERIRSDIAKWTPILRASRPEK